MAVSDWLRPPRHLVVLFLGIALILISALAWLGWRLFQQDRALEQQRVQVRLEHAADIVAAELTRGLGAIEDQLTKLSTVSSVDLPDSAEQFAHQFSQDAVLLVLESDDLEAYPNGRLLFYPVTTPAPEPNASVFAEGEALEFRRQDLAGAAERAGRLAVDEESETPGVAGADDEPLGGMGPGRGAGREEAVDLERAVRVDPDPRLVAELDLDRHARPDLFDGGRRLGLGGRFGGR